MNIPDREVITSLRAFIMNIHFITGFFLGICCSLLLYIIVKIIKAKNKEAQNILYQNMTEQMQCHFENISNKLLCNISQNFFQQNQDILKNFSLQFREKIEDFQNQISKNVQLEHESAKNFSQQSRENFELFFSQFREKIENFQKITEKNFQTELENFIKFDNNIKNFIDAGNKIAKDTNSIVVTLKSDNRTQGIWGEIVLERVLESSGLRKNEEYILQKSTPTGRPDAIILLPEKRCVMIDAKTSLSSFSAYISATTDQEKQKALQSFQESTQSHIAKLTAREYSIYEDYTVAEYVLMFIPIESCYSFFFCDNNKLWDLAWKNKIMPVSPSTLLASLKIINSFLMTEKQNKNALEIAKLCTSMLNKFIAMSDDITKAQKSINNALTKLEGRSGIVSTIEKIETLGITHSS